MTKKQKITLITLPDLTLPGLDGAPTELARLRGTKVVLFVWASW